jgi:hypothetical protein
MRELNNWWWKYSEFDDYPYGDDTTYKLGMEWLSDCERVEDWGCGTTYARKFCRGWYTGIDGGEGRAHFVKDLRFYTSNVEGIFMRHVLEHNEDWKMILCNAISSFTKKMVIILFTPLSVSTKNLSKQEIPVISFSIKDLIDCFPSNIGWNLNGPYKTSTQYGEEYLLEAHKKYA